jgi:hypothetical protein
MKIDVPGCAAIRWLCALPQEWPSARDRPLGAVHQEAIRRRLADSDVRLDTRTSGRRLSDVIFPKMSKVTTLVPTIDIGRE